MMNHLITSSVLIVAVLLIQRLSGKWIPQRLRYALWLVVAVKLLFPLPVANPWNMLNLWKEPLKLTDDRMAEHEVENNDNSASLIDSYNNSAALRELNNTSTALRDADNSSTALRDSYNNSTVLNDFNYSSTALNDSYNSSTVLGDFNNNVDTHTTESIWDSFSTDSRSVSFTSDSLSNSFSAGSNSDLFAAESIWDSFSADNRSVPFAADSNSDTFSNDTNRTEIAPYSSFRRLAGFLWIAGFLITAGIFFLSNHTFNRRLRRTCKKKDIYRGTLPVYETSEVASPCLFGLFRPAIYLPDDLSLNQEEEAFILLHEWTHYRHADPLWTFLRCACLSLYWFHPLVWLAAVRSAQDSELACDEGVLLAAGIQQGKQYGLVLLEMCSRIRTLPHRRFLLSTEMTGGKKEMKKRIEAIAFHRNQKIGAVAVACMVVLLAAGATFGTFTNGTNGDSSSTIPSNDASEITQSDIVQSDENSSESTAVSVNIPADENSSEHTTVPKSIPAGDYYETHSDEEIRKDLDLQLELIANKHNLWVNDHERTLNYTVLNYTLCDLDQNGRLEVISTLEDSRDTTFFLEQVFEVNENRTSLVPCKIITDSDDTEDEVDEDNENDDYVDESSIKMKSSLSATLKKHLANSNDPIWEDYEYKDVDNMEDYSIQLSGYCTAYKDQYCVIHYAGWGSGYDDQADWVDFRKEGDEIYIKPVFDEESETYYRKASFTKGTIWAYNFKLDYQTSNELWDVVEYYWNKPSEIKAILSANLCDFRFREKVSQPFNLKEIYWKYGQAQKRLQYFSITDNGLLLLAKKVLELTTREGQDIKCAIEAEIYAYDSKKKEVVYIGPIQSGGSSSPIEIGPGGCLLTGYHHSSEKFRVVDGVGYVERVDGLNMDVPTPKRYTLETLQNGTRTHIKTVDLIDDMGVLFPMYSSYEDDEHSIVKFGKL